MADDDKQTNETTRKQWQTLEQASRSKRGLGESTILSVVRHVPAGPFSPLIASLVVLVLLGVTLYVGWLVRNSMRSNLRDSLHTVLAANVKALELWLDDQRDTVTQLANDDQIREMVRQLNQKRDANIAWTRDELSDDELAAVERLDKVVQLGGYLGWAIADSSGKVIHGSRIESRGMQIPLTDEATRDLVAGRARITLPFFSAVNQNGIQSKEAPRTAVMCAMAPVQSDLHTLGAIALEIDPADQFTEILSVARTGASGETYAFDRQAVMISSSRFEAQLVTAGLLPASEPSPLRVHVRDPRVDIRHSADVPRDSQNWPMTRMADSATRGGDGFDVIGYNDYRGVPVVGVWRWLGDYDFGVTTELDVDEAFSPFRILRNSFFALLGAVTIAGISLVGLAWVTRPRHSNDDRVEQLRRRLGQYDLQQTIGRGGMGTVYLGAHGLLNRKVAIKVLENADATERSLTRFQREVQLSSSLMHPNTIEIYDFGRTEDGTFFYVMEYVDGISLEQLVSYYGRQPAERVIYLLLQICGSLNEAHEAGMVHRDIKPANVLLTSRSGIHDLIKVLDFGLAKQLDHESLQLTRVDSLTGTPLYMSPESIRDASAAGVLSDIYSIGAVGYTLFCGVPPFSGESSTEICARKLHEPPEPPEKRLGVSVSRHLQDVLMRCLQLEPADRPQSAKQLAAELLACPESPRWTQADAALWWQEVFDGPYLDDFEMSDAAPADENRGGDTAVSEKRPVANAAQSTAS